MIAAPLTWIETLGLALQNAGLKVRCHAESDPIAAYFYGATTDTDRLACATVFVRKLTDPRERRSWYQVSFLMPDGSRKEFEEDHTTSDEDIIHLVISYLTEFTTRNQGHLLVRHGLPTSTLQIGDVHVQVRFQHIE